LINAVAGIGAIGAAVGAWIAGGVAYARLRSDGVTQERDIEAGPADLHPRVRKFLESPQLRGASTGLAIAARNWRGLGFRVVGLRRVDARTAGPVSVRSAVIGQVFDQAWQATTKSPFQSRVRRQGDRLSALEPQLRALKRKHTGDREASQRAVMDLYEANDVNALAGCGWLLAGEALSHAALALVGSREGRTVRDQITGTRVIVDR